MLIRLENVAREFSGKTLLSGVTAQINSGDHIGLIGGNGSGKTSLLRLLIGNATPDAGSIVRSRDLSIAEVPQVVHSPGGHTMLEEALSAFQGLRESEARLQLLERQISEAQDHIPPGLAHEYEQLQLQVALGGGYDYRARAEAALLGLGFRGGDLEKSCSFLSGGEISRLLLAKAVLKPSNLLLLDEPTNHLDLDGILWLTAFLRERRDALVVVSHDRRFLDQVTRYTWEIERGRLSTYTAGFSESRLQKADRIRLLQKEFEKQEELRKKTEDFIRRNIAGQKTRQAQSRRRMLAKMQHLEKPVENSSGLSLRIDEAPRGGLLSFKLEGLSVGYGNQALVREIDLTVWRGDRIAILGGNGSGKSTILKSLVSQIPTLRGSTHWGPNTQASYYSQSPSFPSNAETVYDCLREMDSGCSDEELRSFAARFLFLGEDVHKSVSELSGGERSRLALARLLFFPANVLILDEPTNHLDIAGREALEAALQEFQGSLIVVSHDLYFIESVAERFFLIDEGRLVELRSLQELTQRSSSRRLPSGPPRNGSTARNSSTSAAAPGLSKNELQRRQRRLREIEEKIFHLETTCKATLQALEQAGDYQQAIELSRKHEVLDLELQALYEDWEELTDELSRA